jgi:BirA family biotin operon repressor/biotin-[acetyl-CoA-carboxylase] ligase
MEPGTHHFPESPDLGGVSEGPGGPDKPGGDDTDPVASWGTALRHTRFGPFEMVGTTGSTNDDLVARAAGPAGDGLVLATDHQTAGRGRLDRRWDAPEGTNLTFSTLLRPDWLDEPRAGPDRRGLVTSALAVSVVEVLMAMGLDAAGKVAGILAELVTGERPAIVVGLGLNVGWPPPHSAN